MEGHEKTVLKSADFSKHRPWVLAIEATLPGTFTPCHEEWESIVLEAGYVFAGAHSINRYYV